MNCSVQGCDRPSKVRGFCVGHYNRLMKTGDLKQDVPLIDRPSRGAPTEFMKSAIVQKTNECIRWPYFCDKTGWATVQKDKKVHKVAQLVMALSGQPKPCERHRVRLTCGCRSCINPAHIEWFLPKTSTSGNSNKPVQRPIQDKYNNLSVLQILQRAGRSNRKQLVCPKE